MNPTWLLYAWLCTVPTLPRPTGECAPLPVISYDTRGECIRAEREAMAANPLVDAHCRLNREVPVGE